MTTGENTRAVIRSLHDAFGENEYPGDAFLQGSFDGCEPYDEAGALFGRTSWAALGAEFLDARYSALSFLSEAGFRFFLPAYLVADVRAQFSTADPLFHLTHGFLDYTHEERVGDRVVARRWGKSSLINPRRYGAATSYDHARYRLSVFTREEAGAIVAYLEWKRASAPEHSLDVPGIDAALASYWLDRALTAPTRASLQRRLADDRAFVEAVTERREAP